MSGVVFDKNGHVLYRFAHDGLPCLNTGEYITVVPLDKLDDYAIYSIPSNVETDIEKLIKHAKKEGWI